MNKYEAVFIIKPDLSEEDKKSVFNQINDAVAKNQGNVTGASVWAEKRKLCFPIRRHQEGLYYLMNFSASGPVVKEISQAYKLNENILRVLITKL
jgi:small subunit ribosomal protein S6